MPIIQGYDDRILAQGFVGGQATPDAFGAQVAQGMGRESQALSNAADTVQKIEEDHAKIWAYNATAKADLDNRKAFTDTLNSLDINDPQFIDKVSKLQDDLATKLKASQDNLVAMAPTAAARRQVTVHTLQNNHTLLAAGAKEQARLTGEYIGKMWNDGTKAAQDKLASDPSNENFDLLWKQSKDLVGSLNVDPTLKMKWLNEREHMFAVTQVKVWASSRPKEFLAMVGSQGGRVAKNGAIRGAVPGEGPGPQRPASSVPVTDGSAVLGAGFEDVVAQTLKSEGGYSPADSNGYPVNYGINGQYHPGVDIKNLTVEDAKKIYKTKYWDAIEADKLPEDLRATAFDSAVNAGVGWTKTALEQAGGDVTKFNQLRREHYRELAKDPAKAKYLDTWLARVKDADPNATTAMAPATVVTVEAPALDLPQVQTLSEEEVAKAAPGLTGWSSLTWQEKVAAVREAEGMLGKDLASDRGASKFLYQEALAAHAAGYDYAKLNDPRLSPDNLVRLWGPEEGARMAKHLQDSLEEKTLVQQFRYLPLQQLEDRVKAMEPKAGGEDFVFQNQRYERIRSAFNTLVTARAKDPMGWAESEMLADPLDVSSPAAFQKTLKDRMGIANELETDYRVQGNLLSNEDAKQIGNLLASTTPEGAVSYIKAMAQATASDPVRFRGLMTQIAQHNSSMAQVAQMTLRQGTVQTATGAQDGTQVAMITLQGALINQGKDITGEKINTNHASRFDDKMFHDIFWNAVGDNAFASMDPVAANQAKNDVYQNVKNYLTGYATLRGVKLEDASRDPDLIQNAINATTGGVVKWNGNSLFKPWGMEDGAFNSQFPVAVKNALDQAGIKDGHQLAVDPKFYRYFNLDEGRYGVLNANGQRLFNPQTMQPVIVDMRGLPNTIPGTPIFQKAPNAVAPADLAAATYGRAGAAAPAPQSYVGWRN